MADPMKIRATLRRRYDRSESADEPRDGNRPAQGLAGQADPGVVHPDGHRDAQRQDRAVGAVGAGRSKNPFLDFNFKGGAKGDKVQITWVDNKGDKRTDEAAIS